MTRARWIAASAASVFAACASLLVPAAAAAAPSQAAAARVAVAVHYADGLLHVSGNVVPARPGVRVAVRVLSGRKVLEVDVVRSRAGGMWELLAQVERPVTALLVAAGPPRAQSKRIRVVPERSAATSDSFIPQMTAEPPIVTQAAIEYMSRDAAGAPARWGTCAPVPYYVNPEGMPPGAMPVIERAFAEASDASGVTFQYAGSTGIVPNAGGQFGVPLDGTVVVAFSRASVVPALAGPVLAIGAYTWDGNPATVSTGPYPRLTAGGITIDLDESVPVSFQVGTTLGSILVHEIGHVMNLDHSPVFGTVMHPYMTHASPIAFTAPERAALRAVATPCP